MEKQHSLPRRRTGPRHIRMGHIGMGHVRMGHDLMVEDGHGASIRLSDAWSPIECQSDAEETTVRKEHPS